MTNYFITAIGTDSGKTVVSAIFVEALKADYWKPIQAGLPRDTDSVQQLITNKQSRFHPEAFLLNTPASPHAAAKIDGINIRVDDIDVPECDNSMVIEGAGGILVPINDEEVVIDMFPKLNARLIVVCNLYLGSINHSLLTIAEIRRRGLEIYGLIFNGPENAESESIIVKKTGCNVLLTVRPYDTMTPDIISKLTKELRQKLNA